MMWSAAGRRLPAARAVLRLQPLRAGSSGSVSQRVLAASVRPPPRQLVQARTFFGLREMLFGDKPKDTTTTTTPASDAKAKATEDPMTTTTTVAAASSTEGDLATANAPPAIHGSQDTISYSVGRYARLADGGVMSTCGKSMVLTTAVSLKSNPNSNGGRRKDFLPLMVDYRVKYHAAGLIPDTARRNEMAGNDEDILSSRVIDRVIRPLFPRDYCEDTQVVATVQSLDPGNDPLVLAVNSTSAALAISDIPWNGPIGCVRVVEVDGQLVTSPTSEQRARATLDVLYAATATRTLMIEAAGDEVPEDRLAEAMRMAHAAVGPIIDQQLALVAEHGKPKREYPRLTVPDDVTAAAARIGGPVLEALFATAHYTKAERQQGEREAYDAILAGLREHCGEDADEAMLQVAAHDAFQQALRARILTGERNCRFDGRSSTTIRQLQVETDVLPMAHGSSVFTRGDTQALCSVTLGPLDRGLRVRSAEQDPADEIEYKHAILHYEFPPYCVNETGRLGGINRRMIGHGALAEKALVPVIPGTDSFPYTIRMTSETMGSDGSSSMATVCGVTMALMDAGVPVKAPVAGISIGLVTAGDPFDGTKEITDYRLVTDILGTEDHYGDMDFKVAGTEAGVTAIQLDVKLPGVPVEILCQGLQHAKKARAFVLKRMALVLAAPRPALKMGGGEIHVGLKFNVPLSSLGALIGTGGANIRELEAKTGCAVSIDRSRGELHVVGPADKVEAAKATILAQTGAQFYVVGDKYEMRVTELMDFGAILESTGPTPHRGFVHITELAHERIESIHDVLQVGQVLDFECIQEGVSGKMSRKALLPAPAGTTPSSSSSNNSSSHSSSSSSSSSTSSRPHAPKRPTSGGPPKRRPKSASSSSSSASSSSKSHHHHPRAGSAHRRTSSGGAHKSSSSHTKAP